MALTIRNLLTPSYSASYTYYQWMIWLYREIFELANWTEVYKTADSAWESASNILLTLTDVAVSSTTTRKITSATGGFVSATHKDMVITLKASSGDNRGMYRILTVEDTNTIWVEPTTAPPAGWTTETGITAEIHNCGQGVLLPTTAGLELVMQAPAATSSSLQAYIKTDTGTNVGDHADIYALPKGDWTTSKTLTTGLPVDINYGRRRARINVYAEDQHILIYFWDEVAGAKQFFWGELTGVVTGDNYPGFVSYDINWLLHDNTGFGRLEMLNDVDASIGAMPMRLASNMVSPLYLDTYLGRRTVNGGRGKSESPLAFMEDVGTGGYIRGKYPILRQTNENYEIYRPMDAAGAFLHVSGGTIIPRNGVNDSMIIQEA